MPDSYDIAQAKATLAANDYVVHKQKSWRNLLERVRVAEVLHEAAEEYRQSTQNWAQTTLHNEIRDLMARCTYLYGVARAHGASVDELAGGWQVTGTNLPTEIATSLTCPLCGTHPYIIQQRDGARHITQFICPEHGLVQRVPRKPDTDRDHYFQIRVP